MTRNPREPAIFWLKTQVGWNETTTHEIAGRDGGPIETRDVTGRELAESIFAILGTATQLHTRRKRWYASCTQAAEFVAME
jgi:hypothetical protein